MTIAAPSDLTTTSIAPFLGALRRRWLVLALVEAALWGLCSGLMVLLALTFSTPSSLPEAALVSFAVAALVGLGLGTLFWLRRPDDAGIAVLADRRFALQQKLSSVLEISRYGPADGPVARALMSGTTGAITGRDPRGLAPLLAPRRLWLVCAIVLLSLLLTSQLLLPADPGTQTARLDAAEISGIAQVLREDAALRADGELSSIADALDDVVARAPEMTSAAFEQQVYALFERVEPRFGRNPAHARTGFEGDVPGGSAQPQAMGAPDGLNTAAGAPGGGTASDPVVVEDVPADAIRTTSLPGMGSEGVSLGLTPPDNAQSGGALESEGQGHEAQTDMPQSRGEAEGAGSGQSNMAGSGALGSEPAPAGAPSVAAGFEETRELTAAETSEGSSTRVALEIDETDTVVVDAGALRHWPLAEISPVERAHVPSGAMRAVERYFIRNLETQP